ncbi:MAG: TolC family protein [Acidobacteriota bacterium]
MSITTRLAVALCSALALAPALAGSGPPGSPAVGPGEAPLTLAAARQKALAASPDLQGLAARLRGAEGAERQAGAFPNPELLFEVEDLGGGDDMGVATQRTLSLGQRFEWPGTRSARTAAARHERDAAARDLDRGRRDLLAEVERRFVALLGAQERVVIAGQNAATAREVTLVVASLVEAGEASPVEAARAESDEALAVIDLGNARRDADLARGRLASLWGDEGTTAAAARGALATSVELPDLEAALATVGALPDLARWDAERTRRDALVALADRQALPDLTLSVGTRTYAGLPGRTWVAGLALPVPLFNRFAGARAEATARRQEAEAERISEEARLRAEVAAAHTTLSSALDEVRILRDQVLPRAERVYSALDEGYRRGKFRLLDLLEARRALAQTRLRFVDALVRLNTAGADLRRLTPDTAGEEHGVAP